MLKPIDSSVDDGIAELRIEMAEGEFSVIRLWMNQIAPIGSRITTRLYATSIPRPNPDIPAL